MSAPSSGRSASTRVERSQRRERCARRAGRTQPARSQLTPELADHLVDHKGDLIGKTREQLRSLHFRRDRDGLQS